ncbi:MAG: HAMP domain-containing histidine kinase [Actinobacteria bacterium]|nr:HAMP domain-containing histidine kinase [Actinomycetota bacterium]
MSLRARLLVAMGAVVVLLVAVGITITRSTEHHLVAQVDAQLRRSEPGPVFGDPGNSTDDTSTGTTGDDGQSADGEIDGPSFPRRTAPPGQTFVAYLGPRSDTLRVLYLPNTTAADASPPDVTADEVRAATPDEPFTASATSGDLRYRVMVSDSGRFGGTLVYALPLEDVDAAMGRLRFVILTSLAVVVGALGLITFWVLRLGVRPVKEMTATAVAIGDGDLSRRIPETNADTEAGQLGSALNRMLGRIEAAFDERAKSEARLRQFVSDASHELRTPVTTIRGYAELYRHGGLESDGALDEAMNRTEAEAVRMGDLVEDLLRLARLDEGRPLRLAPVSLDQVNRDAALDAAAVDADRPVTVRPGPPVSAVADDALVRQVVANLLTNVRVHTPPGTHVTLSTEVDGQEAVLTVADDGPGMAPEHAARAFERFYRADASRDRHTGGSGLGLSIVGAVLDAHGGRAEIDSAPGRGTTVRLRFPVAGPPRPRTNDQVDGTSAGSPAGSPPPPATP